MQESKTVWSLIFLLATGCASSHGFDRSAIREALHIDPTTDQDSRPIMDPALDFALPFRLGVFFAEHDFPNRPSIRKVEWLSSDRDRLLRLLAPLRVERIVSETIVLLDATLRAGNIHRIRQAGSRYGADAVLIVEGAAAVDRYNNGYASLYPTLIGAHLAPGTESHALVTVTGSFLGVKSEWHSPPQTVEGVSKVVGPAFFVDNTIVVGQAKEAAIDALSKLILDNLRLRKEGPHRATLPSR